MDNILSIYMRSVYNKCSTGRLKSLPKFSILINTSAYEKLYMCNGKLYEVHQRYGCTQIFRIELLT